MVFPRRALTKHVSGVIITTQRYPFGTRRDCTIHRKRERQRCCKLCNRVRVRGFVPTVCRRSTFPFRSRECGRNILAGLRAGSAALKPATGDISAGLELRTCPAVRAGMPMRCGMPTCSTPSTTRAIAPPTSVTSCTMCRRTPFVAVELTVRTAATSSAVHWTPRRRTQSVAAGLTTVKRPNAASSMSRLISEPLTLACSMGFKLPDRAVFLFNLCRRFTAAAFLFISTREARSRHVMHGPACV